MQEKLSPISLMDEHGIHHIMFQLLITREIFWTDSEPVLGYIRNQSRKFKPFVANRAEIIHENSCDSQ